MVESASKKINEPVAKKNIPGKIYKQYIELAQEIDELSSKKDKKKKDLNERERELRREKLPVFLKEKYYEPAAELLTKGFVQISELNYVEKIEL